MKTLLVVSQVYPPDPASVGQHLHDVARAMVERGHRVVVLSSRRGYDDPGVSYARHERREGVEIHRLSLTPFGKGSLLGRTADAFVFTLLSYLRSLALPATDATLVSTSPPLACLAIPRLARRAPVTYWVMDLNPDQAIATGAVSSGSLRARWLERAQRAAARASSRVILLDRFMRDRVEDRWSLGGETELLPPWPHEDQLQPVDGDDNPFLRELGLEDRRIVMYSGNISPVHPIQTLLEAARQLRDTPQVQLVFIGSEAGRRRVEQWATELGVENLTTLPYQPLDRIRYSLSAADVHLVSMGEPMVGVVHPCKIYGAMALGKPVFYLGPRESHIGDVLARWGCGWQVEHGDLDRAARLLREIGKAEAGELAAIGAKGREAVTREFPQQGLRERICQILESTFGS